MDTRRRASGRYCANCREPLPGLALSIEHKGIGAEGDIEVLIMFADGSVHGFKIIDLSLLMIRNNLKPDFKTFDFKK